MKFSKLRENKSTRAIIFNAVLAAVSLFVNGFGIYLTIQANLGAAPWDSLLLGLTKRAKKLPIGVISIALLSSATLIGWILGGPVGIGTLICAFASGPILQTIFRLMKFDATGVKHQRLQDSAKVVFGR